MGNLDDDRIIITCKKCLLTTQWHIAFADDWQRIADWHKRHKMTCQTPDVDPPEFPVYVDAQGNEHAEY